MSSNRSNVNLQINAALLKQFEAYASASHCSLEAAIEAAMETTLKAGHQTSHGPITAQDPGAREALTKLKQRTAALENLTRQMTTHMRMLQEELDQLKTPTTPSQQQQITEMLPALADDFAADF